MATEDKGHSELRGQKVRIALTAEGKVHSYSRPPVKPKSVMHFTNVLESSLRKSLVLEGITSSKADREVNQQIVIRLTELFREIRSESCPVDPEDIPAVQTACKTLGLTCEEGLLLVSRAQALERLVRHTMIPRHVVALIQDKVRKRIWEAKQGGYLVSLTADHLEEITLAER